MTDVEGWSVGAYGLLTNERDEMLLVHRRDRDIWQLPGGGVRKDETLVEAVVREVEEESGYKVVPLRVTAIYVSVRRRDIVFYYFCGKVAGEPRTNDEADEIKFVLARDLPAVTDGTQSCINHYLSGAGDIDWRDDLE